MRFLYSLGFEKESFFNVKGYENWKFEHTPKLQEALDFYFDFRQRNKGDNENGNKAKEKEDKWNL